MRTRLKIAHLHPANVVSFLVITCENGDHLHREVRSANGGMNADERRQVPEGRLAGKVSLLERNQVTCLQISSCNCSYGNFYIEDVFAVRGRPELTRTVLRVTLPANGDAVPTVETR